VSQQDKSAVERWVDDNRELILLGAVLPIGKVLSLKDAWDRRRTAPDPAAHDARVARVQRDVRAYRDARDRGEAVGLLRTDRRGDVALNARISDKSGDTRVRVGDLRAILGLDEARGVVRVEPLVTTGELVDWLDGTGWQLETAIEMRGATLGGLCLAIGMTTHSHVSGLQHDIVETWEIVTPRGERIEVTRDGEHADLFRGLPWSHGTLGFLVGLELRVVRTPTHVRLRYRPFHDREAYLEAHTAALTADDPPWFLEGQIFGRDRAVLIEGEPVDPAGSDLPVVDVAHWQQPFFFKRVESMLDLPAGGEHAELVPMASYLLRHERSMCMTMGQILPTANDPRFRRWFGWMMPPHMPLLKRSRPLEERLRTMRNNVYQDFGFPVEHLGEVLHELHETFEIYPLLVYPCRVVDRGGMVRVPGQHGVPWDGEVREARYINLGIYGPPRAIREGDPRYPTVTRVRGIEARIRELGGFLHTYVDVFSTEAEFEAMFDHTLWRELRARYDADDVLPTVYDKVRPEVDPLAFLDEEATWIAESTP
jgi:delta24-sterol reductase